MIKQTQTNGMPITFIWEGYKWTKFDQNRFGGHAYQCNIDGDLITIYANRNNAGMICIFTGMHNWAAAWKSTEMCRLDHAVMYYPGTAGGPLDIYRFLEI